MQTPIGKAIPETAWKRGVMAAAAMAIVALDLFLTWKGQYMTPYRLGLLMAALALYGNFTQWHSPSLGLVLRPAQGFRYWLLAALGIGVLMLAIIAVSLPILAAFGKHISLGARSPSESLRWFYFTCINAPILEEVVYRFILCVPLVAILGGWPTIVLSTIAFASLHFVAGVASPDNVVAGLFLSWAFLKSGSLAVPITLHALGNMSILVASLAMWFWKG